MKSVMTRIMMSILVMGITVPTLTGCASDQLQKERNALWLENQELRAESERLTLANDSLQQQLAAKPETVKETVYVEREAAKPDASALSNVAGVDVIQNGNDIAVRIPGDVLFGPGSKVLKSNAKKKLAEIAGIVKREYAGNKIRVEGYTDRDPIKKSGWQDNLELSAQRAMAVQRYLSKRGVKGSKMYSAAFGSNKAQRTKEKSRRVEIVVIGD